MTKKTTPVKLPRLLKINKGTICLSKIDPKRCNNIDEFEEYVTNAYHILALLSEEDRATADEDADEYFIETKNQAALKYAYNNCLLSEPGTFFLAAVEHVMPDGFDMFKVDAVEQICDTKVDKGLFEIVLLEDGNLYVRIDD